MTKSKALRKYLKTKYGIDVEGMSIVSVLRNWLGVTGSTVSEVLNASVDSHKYTFTFTKGVNWPDTVELPAPIEASYEEIITLPTFEPVTIGNKKYTFDNEWYESATHRYFRSGKVAMPFRDVSASGTWSTETV